MPHLTTVFAPKSSIAGLAWPGLPGRVGTKILALLHQLEESQWWTPEALREHQFEQLQGLLRHAAETVPYYGERIRAAGIDATKRITPEAWSRIPILKRDAVQGSLKALRSRRYPGAHGKLSEITSSGSTGKPVKVLGTELTALFWDVLTVRDHLWHERDLSRSLAAIRFVKDDGASYPRGARSKDWGAATAAVFRTGPGRILNVSTPVEQQVEWLERQNPDYLITNPSNLRELVRCSEQAGIDLPNLRQVQTFAEVLDPDVRTVCREAWHVPVADTYSAAETGYLALQCPSHEHYHVQSESVFLEIVDNAGRECAPGEIGRVLVTPLHNFATPLIRYDIGDYAEVGKPCGCGRGLPVLTRILGRVRNLLTLPSGERRWPFFRYDRYNDIAPITQFQFVQKTREHIEVRLVSLRQVTEGEENELRNLIIARLGYPFELTFTYHDEIPRSAGGKYEDFKSELEG